jgi:hypothetical protein
MPSIIHGCINKRRFRNRTVAEGAAKAATIRAKVSIGVYQCFFCNHWHLSEKAPPTHS